MAKTKDAPKAEGQYLEFLSEEDKKHLARLEALTNLMIKNKIPVYKQGDYELAVALEYHEKIDTPDLSKLTQAEIDKLAEGEFTDEEMFKSSR